MPSLPPCCRLQLKALAILSLYTFVVMLFVSNDSPLASINNHVDSAIFFMSGKAWANGLIPLCGFLRQQGSPPVVYRDGRILDFADRLPWCMGAVCYRDDFDLLCLLADRYAGVVPSATVIVCGDDDGDSLFSWFLVLGDTCRNMVQPPGCLWDIFGSQIDKAKI